LTAFGVLGLNDRDARPRPTVPIIHDPWIVDNPEVRHWQTFAEEELEGAGALISYLAEPKHRVSRYNDGDTQVLIRALHLVDCCILEGKKATCQHESVKTNRDYRRA
jgi:hypothetical protein